MEKSQEIILELLFVCAVVSQILREILVMGICKSVDGVVDQLSQGIIVEEIKPFLLLQPLGKAVHVSAGIFVVMPPQPLTTNRALETVSYTHLTLPTKA